MKQIASKDCPLNWKDKDGNSRYYETKREAVKVAKKRGKAICQSCSGYYFLF